MAVAAMQIEEMHATFLALNTMRSLVTADQFQQEDERNKKEQTAWRKILQALLSRAHAK